VTAEQPPRKLSLGKKIAFSGLAVVMVLLGLELGLAAFQVDPLPARTNTWFPDHILAPPLWHVSEVDGAQFLRSGQSSHFRPFAVPGADRAYRIAVLGGSAAHGYGVLEPGAFPHRVEQLLQTALPDREVQVLNLGTVAWSSQQLAWASQYLWDYSDWDLVIIYSGNNELLELASWKSFKAPEEHARYTKVLRWNQRLSWSRIYAALHQFLSSEAIDAIRDSGGPEAEVEPAMFKHEGEPILGGAEEREARAGFGTQVDPALDPIPEIPAMGRDDLVAIPREDRARMGELEADYAAGTYTHNIRRILKRARKHDTPVLLMNPAPNDYQDPAWFPWKGPDGERVNELLDEATAIVQADVSQASARKLVEEALTLQPEDPRALYFMANLTVMADPARARELFDRARRLAEYPNRVVPSVTEAILKLEGTRGVVGVLDIEQTFRDLSETGLIGYDLVYDHCHPSIEGNLVIAGEIVRFLLDREVGLDGARSVDVDAWVQQRRQELSSRAAPDDRLWEWMGVEWPEPGRPKYIADFQGEITDLRRRLEDAAAAEDATALDLVRAGNARFYDWEVEHALSAWQAAIRTEPSLCLAFANSAYALKSVGQREQALKRARMAEECDPDNAEYAEMVTLLKAVTKP